MELDAEPGLTASALLIQNLVRLCSDLRLPVAYKVNEVEQADAGADARRTFYIVVHVLGDSAFKKYLQHCCQSDLMLFRGLLLKVTADASLSKLHSARVQQAFLPKFENEGQDASVADAIVAAANERYMVATIKHSGSLVTLSGSQGFAAKNSLNNEFTAGAAALLQAHYLRLAHGEAAAAQARLAALMDTLRRRHMALSFEMVTGCHGHHGQLPAAEYLVTTSAHAQDHATGRPVFLPWQEFMAFCLEQGLPINDTWLMAGTRWAAAARDALDDLALRGGPTATALSTLTALVEDGHADGCLYLPGTYPHDQWQGSRIEGFVIAQGQSTDAASAAKLEQLLPTLRDAVLPLGSVPGSLHQPYRELVTQYNGDTQAVQDHVTESCRGWLPTHKLQVSSKDDKEAVVALLSSPLPGKPLQLGLPSGGLLYSRQAMAEAKASALEQLAYELEQQQQLEGVDKGRAATLKLLRQAGDAAEGGSRVPEAERKVLQVQLVRALAGAPEVHQTLRYKKKMTMWSFGSSKQGEVGSDAVMGYCLMTFVIRNGLKALSLSPETYYSYISSLTRNWGLPKRSEAQLQLFARAWVAWVEQHGGTSQVQEGRYLDFAEPFVAEFLRRRGDMPMAGVSKQRPEGSFQGVLVLVDAPYALAKKVQERLCAQHLLTVDKQVPAFTKTMVRQGVVVWSPEGAAMPKSIQQFAKDAAAHTFLAVQRLVPGEGLEFNGSGSENAAGKGVAEPAPKKQKQQGGAKAKQVGAQGKEQGATQGKAQGAAQTGLQASKIKPFEQALGALDAAIRSRPPPRKKVLDPLPANVRTALMPPAKAAASADASPAAAGAAKAGGAAAKQPAARASSPAPPLDPVVDKALDAAAADIAAWLGRGAPVPPPDPAVICCFITIPGTGKTVLTAGLQTSGPLAGLSKGQQVVKAPPGAKKGPAPMEVDGGPGAAGTTGGGSSPEVVTALQVKVLNSDTMKAKTPGFKASHYWPDVSDAADTCVGGGSVTLVIADKNLVPNPRGNLEKAMGDLSASGASTLAVLPTCTGTTSQELLPELYQGMPELPMPLEFVALCMLRVLNRKKHEGNLDADNCKEAASVVAMFAAFYRNTGLSQLRQQVQSVFGTVLELPIMRGIGEPAAGAPPGPAGPASVSPKMREVLAHIAAGITKVNTRGDPALGEWEQQARELLQDKEVSAALQALQTPLGELQAQVAAALAARIAATVKARSAPALRPSPSLSSELQSKLSASDNDDLTTLVGTAPGRRAPTRWIGIAALSVEPLLDATKALPLGEEVSARVAAGRPDYHVTLWHVDDPRLNQQEGLKEALMAAVGQEVALEVVAIDTSADVTAAQVQLLTAPDEAMNKQYHHITLAVGPEATPKDANELPEKVQAGTAQRYVLPEPVQLVGQILAFSTG